MSIDLKYTEDLIPIKDIINGIIVKTDDSLIKVFEIEPSKLLLMEDALKCQLFIEWGYWLKTISTNIQIKVVSQRTDIEKFLSELKSNYNNDDENETVKKFIIHNLDFTRTMSYNNSIDKRFYLIVPYEKGNCSKSDPIEKKIQDFKMMLRYTEQNLRRFGVNVISHDNEDAAIANFIYNYTNRKTSEYVTLDARLERLSEDIRKVYNLNNNESLPPINTSTLICPLNINSEKDSEYLIVDGEYQMTLGIATNGYPESFTEEWFNSFINLGNNIDIDFFLKREDDNTFLQRTARKLNVTAIQARDKSLAAIDSEEVNQRLNSCYYISESIKKNNSVYYMNILLTIHAPTEKKLYETVKYIKENRLKTPYKILSLKSLQLEAFKSILPLNDLNKRIFNRTKQNMVTSDLTLCYPFITHRLSDINGYLLGINGVDSSVVMIDNFDTRKYVNSNMLLVGTTGAGKTFTLLTILTRMRLKGIKSYVISPDKQDEFRRVTDALGGVFVNMSPSSRDRINIFEIRPQAEPDIAIVGENYEADSWLSEKIQQVNIFFSLVITDITIQESSYIDKTLKAMYSDFGITEENDTIYIDVDNKKLGLKHMPIMEDFY